MDNNISEDIVEMIDVENVEEVDEEYGDEEAMLQQALAMSIEFENQQKPVPPDPIDPLFIKYHQLLPIPFLVNRNNEQYPIDILTGNIVGLFFVDESKPSLFFIQKLLKYCESHKNNSFVVVIIYLDQDPNRFYDILSMSGGWLGIPLEQNECISDLCHKLKFNKSPLLVLCDEYGNVISDQGVSLIFKMPLPFGRPDPKVYVENMKQYLQCIEQLFILIDKDNDLLISNQDFNKSFSFPHGQSPFFFPSIVEEIITITDHSKAPDASIDVITLDQWSNYFRIVALRYPNNDVLSLVEPLAKKFGYHLTDLQQ